MLACRYRLGCWRGMQTILTCNYRGGVCVECRRCLRVSIVGGFARNTDDARVYLLLGCLRGMTTMLACKYRWGVCVECRRCLCVSIGWGVCVEYRRYLLFGSREVCSER